MAPGIPSAVGAASSTFLPGQCSGIQNATNSFTAQYGWSTGNVINVVTKSGGSSLHGVAYDYLRNGKLDANSYSNNINGQPKPNSHRNQFGVAIGGPVYIPGLYKQRDKTFFFFNYEGHRQNDPLSTTNNVPTTAFVAATSRRSWAAMLDRMHCVERFWQGRYMILLPPGRLTRPVRYPTLTRIRQLR